MNRLKDLIGSPLSVKILFVIYLFLLCSTFSTLVSIGLNLQVSDYIFPVVYISLLILMFFKVSWTWKAGILECVYLIGTLIYEFFQKDEAVSSVLTSSVLNIPEFAKVTTVQKEIFVDFLINVILVVSLLGASFISFLWYRSRIYFKK